MTTRKKSVRRSSSPLIAGYAAASITPPSGTHLFGFGNRDRVAEGCTSIIDQLWVKAVYAEQPDESLLILSYDLLFFDRVEADRLKAAVGRILDLLPRQILINCSHTHVGPVNGTWGYAGYEHLKDPLYMDDVERATLKAARQARDTAVPASLWTGETRSSLPVSRRHINADGIAEWRPAPEARVYDRIPLMLFRDLRRQRALALIYCVSCHPSTMGGQGVSADYPGVASDLIAEQLDPGAGAVFLQGCGGDTKACVIANGPADDTGLISWRSGNIDDVRRAGQLVAEAVVMALPTLNPVTPLLKSGIAETLWPLSPPPSRSALEKKKQNSQRDLERMWAARMIERLNRGETLAAEAPVLLQAIRWSDSVRMIAFEGEPVADWGYFLLKKFKKGLLFPLGYSNGQGLYLPSEAMLPQHGYEVDSALEYGFPSNLKAGFEQVVTKALRQFHIKGIL